MNEITSIASVFRDYRAYYLRKKKELDDIMKALPAKGSVRKKKIGSRDYYYLGYREGKKVKTDYIGNTQADEKNRYCTLRPGSCQEIPKPWAGKAICDP